MRWVFRVEFKSGFVEEKNWKNVCDRRAGCGMATLSDIDWSNWVYSEPMADILIETVIDWLFYFFLTTCRLLVGFAGSSSFSWHKIRFFCNKNISILFLTTLAELFQISYFIILINKFSTSFNINILAFINKIDWNRWLQIFGEFNRRPILCRNVEKLN